MTAGHSSRVIHLQLGSLWSQLSLSPGFHLSECCLFVPPFLSHGWNGPSASFLWPFCAGLLNSPLAQSQAPCYISLTPAFQVPLYILLVSIAGGGALSHSSAVVSPSLSASPSQSGQLSIVAALQKTSYSSQKVFLAARLHSQLHCRCFFPDLSRHLGHPRTQLHPSTMAQPSQRVHQLFNASAT